MVFACGFLNLDPGRWSDGCLARGKRFSRLRSMHPGLTALRSLAVGPQDLCPLDYARTELNPAIMA